MDDRPWEIPLFSAEEGKRRHRKVREGMAYRGIDCLIVSGHLGFHRSQAADLRYLSNFRTWDDAEHMVFPLEGEPTLFVWSTGHEYWAKKVSWVPVKVSKKIPSRGRNYAGQIADRIKELGLEKGTLGIVNMQNMSAAIYVALREYLPHAKFESARDILVQCRVIKSPEELAFVRKAAECGDRGIEALAKAARPGVDEYTLTAECDGAITRAGGEYGCFILIESCPWSERGISIREAGSRKKLQSGDIILDEITPSYGGYYIQVLRPISLGKPPDDFLRLHDLHCELYELARKELRPGNTKAEATVKLEELASKKGDFNRVWALQDADMSEVDIGANPMNAELKPGMVLVNHPSTQFTSGKGHAGHILGDTFIITEGEPECVGRLSREVIVV